MVLKIDSSDLKCFLQVNVIDIKRDYAGLLLVTQVEHSSEPSGLEVLA